MGKRNRNSLEYEQGFQIEAEAFGRYEKDICKVLELDNIELTARGLLDKVAGIDAIGENDKGLIGISLRFRSKDYGSFTLSRHISDPHSEIHKWLHTPSNTIQPKYHLTISGDNITAVQIPEFREVISTLVKMGAIDHYYSTKLDAYEFETSKFSNYTITYTLND